MDRKKSFILYCDYKQHIDLLTLEEKGMLLDCIFEYSNTGEVIETSGTVKMAFSFIKSQLDRDRERYADKCAANKKNGEKGGRPPKPKESEDNPDKPNGYSENQSEAKKPDTDTDTDTDTDNDNGTVNETETDTDTDNDNGTVNETETGTDTDNDNGTVNETETGTDTGTDNNDSMKQTKETKAKKTDVVYSDDIELNEAIKDFVKHRKVIKSPMSDKAIELFVNKLNRISNDTDEKIELINTAIECGWKTVYPKKKENQRKEKFSVLDLTEEDFRKAGML